ncbi:MAG TPA: hypothetical protein VGO62_17190 [Myxococcota bacterium]|jgi:hypothetical protein
MPIAPAASSTTRILGSAIELDSDVARKLDTNGDGNVDEAELQAGSKRDLGILRAEVSSEVTAASQLSKQTEGRRNWKAWAKGGSVALIGSAVLTPIVGIPLGILAGASDAFGAYIHPFAKDAADTGARAMSLIDLQIAHKS